MTHPDAARWNARYTAEREEWLERKPRQLLVDFASQLPKRGLALDAAAGVSANGLFLAQRGLHVIALDISETALKLAVNRARALTLPIDAAVYDLTSPWLPEARFDVIINFRFLARETIPIYQQSLKPGGWLFFETFVKTFQDLPHLDYYLDPGELLRAYQDFEILFWREDLKPDSGRAVAQLVARKPAGSMKG